MRYRNFAKHGHILKFNFKVGQFYALVKKDHVLIEFREL